MVTFTWSEIHGGKCHYHQRIVTIGINGENKDVARLNGWSRGADTWSRNDVVRDTSAMVQRNLAHNGLLTNAASISNRLLAWIELV